MQARIPMTKRDKWCIFWAVKGETQKAVTVIDGDPLCNFHAGKVVVDPAPSAPIPETNPITERIPKLKAALDALRQAAPAGKELAK